MTILSVGSTAWVEMFQSVLARREAEMFPEGVGEVGGVAEAGQLRNRAGAGIGLLQQGAHVLETDAEQFVMHRAVQMLAKQLIQHVARDTHGGCHFRDADGKAVVLLEKA